MITEELKQRLACQTAEIKALARLKGEQAELTYRELQTLPSALSYLPERMKAIEDRGLLINKNWITAQAEAARFHGLSYLNAGNQSLWVDPDDPALTDDEKSKLGQGRQARSNNYFINLIDRINDHMERKNAPSDYLAPPRTISIPKVDLALLAHACQFPVESFFCEVDRRTVPFRADPFHQFIYWHREDKDLFVAGFDFLQQFSSRANGQIIVEEVDKPLIPPSAPLPGMGVRGIEAIAEPQRMTGVQAGKPIQIRVKLPDQFTKSTQPGSDVLVLERDEEGQVMLVSSHMFVDGDTRFEGDEIQIPRLFNATEGDLPAKFCLTVPGKSTLFVLLMQPADTAEAPPLNALPVFERTTETAFRTQQFKPELGNDDFSQLKKTLLQRDADSWQILYHDFQVLPAV